MAGLMKHTKESATGQSQTLHSESGKKVVLYGSTIKLNSTMSLVKVEPSRNVKKTLETGWQIIYSSPKDGLSRVLGTLSTNYS